MVIEAEIITYLNEVLDIPVYPTRPASNPNPEAQTYVVVDMIGGSRSDLLRHATIAVQTYASSNQEAAEVMEEVIQAMDSTVQLEMISAAHLSAGPYRFPLTASKQPRYQAVYEITYY